MHRRVTTTLPCVLLVLVLAGEASSAGRPSFDLESCTWNATDVVVATEGDSIDGRLTVIESWVGALEAGTELHLPALAAFAPVEKRQERELFRVREDGVTVTGDRMVLFLRRGPGPDHSEWRPAAEYGGLEVSVCWVESGGTFGLMQIMNPGPAVLVRLEGTEAQMRARVRELRAAKAELARIRALGDVGARVEAAAPFAASDAYLVMTEAIDVLRASGKAAIPSLLSLAVRDEPSSAQGAAFSALGAIGDPSAVKPIVALLEEELGYWEKAVEQLQPGWWNGQGLARDAVSRHHWHYGRVYDALRALQAIATPGYESIVRRTRSLWRSHPTLDEIGSGQIVARCDAALAALGADRRPPK